MNSIAKRRLFVEAGIDLLPPVIRRAVLDDEPFLKRWDISTVTSVTLGMGGPSFRRDRLYESIRNALATPDTAFPVPDQDDVTWDMRVETTGKSPQFVVSSNGKRYSLVDHSALANDAPTRTNWFERVAGETNFGGSAYGDWLTRLRRAPLKDEECAQLLADIELTPVKVYRSIRLGFESGKLSETVLVPNESSYFDRLVGCLRSAKTVAEYVDDGATSHISDLVGTRGVSGLSYALLSCSFGQLASAIRIHDFDREELREIYQWLVEQGDPISRVGAVEVALAHLDSHPELAPYVEQIVEATIADDPKGDGSSFALLSALIVVVGSELARRQIFGNATPPFYRRQATIAQASLSFRAVVESRLHFEEATRWARGSGFGHIFFLQGLVDLRGEPRWLPDFVDSKQLRAEFLGRMLNAAAQNQSLIPEGTLRTLVLGPGSKLATAAEWPFPFLPGPLEGAIKPSRTLPPDLFEKVKGALEEDSLEADSFAGLVNAALLFDVPKDLSGLAAAALRRVNFSIESIDDEAKAFGLVAGLATVAAAGRGTDLAEALRVLTRVLRRRRRLAAAPEDEMRVAMIAAASFDELEKWAKFAGEWITEIAFVISEKESAVRFLRTLRRLVHIEPTLARHCAIADAALAGFAG